MENTDQKHHTKSQEHLKRVLKEELTKISVETPKPILESMSSRLQLVIRANEYATKY